MTPTTIERPHPFRPDRVGRSLALGAAACLALGLSACGGGDDDTEATTTSSSLAVAVTTTVPVAATTTAPAAVTTTSVVTYVTEGATVIVANASGINGAAGRLTDRLAQVGFTTTGATNSAESVSNLTVTQIYYDPAVEAALAVAESVRAALGGGDIEVLEVEVPALTESGELGDAQVLVLMGNDVADKSLAELQGTAPPTEDTTDDTTDDAGGDTDGGDESTTTTAADG